MLASLIFEIFASLSSFMSLSCKVEFILSTLHFHSGEFANISSIQSSLQTLPN